MKSHFITGPCIVMDSKVTVQELNSKLDETFKLMDGKDQDGYITNEEYFSYWKDWDKTDG